MMDTNEIADVLERVQGWPIAMRVALARQILETAEHAPKKPLPLGPSAAEVAAMFRTGKPAPDDETVEQWLAEHRLAKYGS